MFLLVANQASTLSTYFIFELINIISELMFLRFFCMNNKSVRMVPPNVTREHGIYFLFDAVKLPVGIERLGI